MKGRIAEVVHEGGLDGRNDGLPLSGQGVWTLRDGGRVQLLLDRSEQGGDLGLTTEGKQNLVGGVDAA